MSSLKKTEFSLFSPREVGERDKEFSFFKFKDSIKDKLVPGKFTHSDHYLKKWLIANDWDEEKAIVMFNKSYEFRQKRNLDELLDNYDPPEVLKKYRPGGFCGKDLDGAPVLYELHGQIDVEGLLRSARTTDLENTKLLQCEQNVKIWKDESRKRGQIVDGTTMILDCENVGTKMMWRPALNLMTHWTDLMEDNYPEMVKKMIVVRAPYLFPILYKMCRPTLSDSLKRKIEVYGSDYREKLKEYISEEELPAYLGGKKKDPDGNPRCATWINQGGIVPTSYYITKLRNVEGMQVTNVSAGRQCFLKFHVKETGSYLEWEFMTEENDIAYRLEYCKKDADNRTKLLETKRVNSQLAPEEGAYKCDKVGYYYLIFDNTYSWFRQKTIYYTAAIIQGVEHNKEVKEELQHMMH